MCTTELGAVARNSEEFKKRNVKVIGLSANDIDSHDRWIKDINEVGKTSVDFPIIGDKDRKIATEYDMLDHLDATNVDQKGLPLTVRTVFVIDPKKQIRTLISYPAAVGRSFVEVLRVIDSLQRGEKHKFTTPVDWQPGQDVIIPPTIKTEDAKALFPGAQINEVRPYLRFVADPSK